MQLSRTGAPENMVVTETAKEGAPLHGNRLDDVTGELAIEGEPSTSTAGEQQTPKPNDEKVISAEREPVGHDEDHSDDSDDDFDWPIQQGASVKTRGMRMRKEQPLRRLGSADQPETAATGDEIIAAQQADKSLVKLREIAGKGKP